MQEAVEMCVSYLSNLHPLKCVENQFTLFFSTEACQVAPWEGQKNSRIETII
jgi:hypothetical protein